MIGNEKRAAKKPLSRTVIDNGNITLRPFYHFKHTTGTGVTLVFWDKKYPCNTYRGYIIKITVIILILNTDIIPL